jgi:hypothetical protein
VQRVRLRRLGIWATEQCPIGIAIGWRLIPQKVNRKGHTRTTLETSEPITAIVNFPEPVSILETV